MLFKTRNDTVIPTGSRTDVHPWTAFTSSKDMDIDSTSTLSIIRQLLEVGNRGQYGGQADFEDVRSKSCIVVDDEYRRRQVWQC